MKDTKKESKELINDYDYLASTASAMDFTGLIPSLPQSDAEIESYNDICQFLPRTEHQPDSSKSNRKLKK